MSQCLRVLSFAVAILMTGLTAAAQGPGGQSGGNLVVDGRFVFALHDGVLFKFDSRSMKLLARVDLGGRPGEARITGEEVATEEIVTEEVVVEEVADPARGAKMGEAAGSAVKTGIAWLVAHQDADGRWDADAFMKHEVDGKPSDGAGNPTKDIGVTALTTLALLGNGSTMRTGPHREQIKAAVKWLRDQQQDNGLIGTAASFDYIYSHAIATLAISEAYGLSRYKLLKPVAQKAINYLESHRNPYGVWRYQPRDNDNDTSVTTWALMSYASAQNWGLDVNEQALQMVASWYDQVTDDNGKAGYTKRGEMSSRKPGDHSQRFPPKNGEAMTAAALFGRFLLDQDSKATPIMAKSAALLAQKPPKWAEGHIDPYYWWFGTQAMYQMGGRHWQAWHPGLKGVIKAQRRDGNFAGSWDPIGVWDMDGGRVYSTAMHTLTLETFSRVARLVR